MSPLDDEKLKLIDEIREDLRRELQRKRERRRRREKEVRGSNDDEQDGR